MAAGRGEFFRSFQAGLDLLPRQPAPGRRQPVRGRGKPRPGGGLTGGRRKKKWSKAAPRQFQRSKNRRTQTKCYQSEITATKGKLSGKVTSNYLFVRLPSEILIQILSYLDASSLFCVSHVSKLFHQLANDDVMWHKIYLSEFGGQTWKPKSVDDAALKEEPVEIEDWSAGHWKKMYFRSVAGQELNKWRRELREVSPYTGLPRQTEWILRNLSVNWELTVCDRSGKESRLEQSRAYFFESSVIVRWSGGCFPSYQNISNIQLHGVRKDALKSPKVRKPGWRSLILKLDMKTHIGRFIGKDRLMKLIIFSPGFIIGIWRGQNRVAFIMVSLHFHRLVEKSLLGSPVCPFSEPVDGPPVDNSDPEFGLHGYTLHFVLHNTDTQIMSGHFRQLLCRTVQIQKGLVELKAINRANLSQHRSLSGNIKLPWKSEEMEGSVENCCIMTLTLLDEFQKPFWCVSAPISITMSKNALSFDYSGEHFLMEYNNPDGQVKMKLVWLKEQKQFFLISLTVYVSVFKVNQHFSTEY
ncbi:F-box only protein 15-like [Scomber japonicus]|uniref:F-box only protein 15-like n=1 Tax=Scomber japonicus TaxID=13676 RepID=UPI002304D9E8|nr:F-box only protein 15-like [Scomber japonicus]